MKLIIDISEEARENFIKRGTDKGVIAQAIENGTPLRSGKWHNIIDDWAYNCSECGADSEEPYPYCPNCGARMESEEEE